MTTLPPGGETADVFTYDPGVPNQSQGGHSCCFDFAAPMGPADQAPSEQYHQVLVYTTEPLRDDLLLIGDAEVVLYAASSAVDTDWTARLCRVAGTHLGEFFGMGPTGRRIEVAGAFVYRLQGGEIVHERRILDFTGLLIQVGVLRAKPSG